MYAQRHSRTR